MAGGKDATDVLNLINSFDGQGDANSLQFFLKNCDSILKIVKVDQKELLVDLIFGTKLKGKAQEVTQYKQFQNWEELKDFLLEHFTDKTPPSHFLTQIMNIKQHFRETVKEYGDRLQILFNKYKETCHLNYANNEATVLIENLNSILVNTFRKGLNDEKIQMRIIAEKTTYLDKALSLAIEMELENNDRFKNSHFKNIGFVERGNRQLNNHSSNNSCLFCFKNNHLTSQCRQLRQYEQNSNSYNRNVPSNNQTRPPQNFNSNNNFSNRQDVNTVQYNQGRFTNRNYNNQNFNQNNDVRNYNRNYGNNYNSNNPRSNYNNRYSQNPRNFNNSQVPQRQQNVSIPQQSQNFSNYNNESSTTNFNSSNNRSPQQIQTINSQSLINSADNYFSEPSTSQNFSGNESEALVASSRLSAS